MCKTSQKYAIFGPKVRLVLLVSFFSIALLQCNDETMSGQGNKSKTTGVRNPGTGIGDISIGSVTFPKNNCGTSGQDRDIVFILDSTTSVSSGDWLQFIRFVESIVSGLKLNDSNGGTRYSILEFGNTKSMTVNSAIAFKKLNFIVGSRQGMSNKLSDVSAITSIAVRKIKESSYDGVGPAILRANEYLQEVGRLKASKEIWAIHDMSCCGFPNQGEKGTQFADAAFVKSQGVAIVGIRTLKSVASSNEIATPGLAFDLGTNISNVSTSVINNIANGVNQTVCSR